MRRDENVTSAADACSTGDEFEGAQPSCVIVDIGHDHELIGGARVHSFAGNGGSWRQAGIRQKVARHQSRLLFAC
jgi:hypothetical protein